MRRARRGPALLFLGLCSSACELCRSDWLRKRGLFTPLQAPAADHRRHERGGRGRGGPVGRSQPAARCVGGRPGQGARAAAVAGPPAAAPALAPGRAAPAGRHSGRPHCLHVSVAAAGRASTLGFLHWGWGMRRAMEFGEACPTACLPARACTLPSPACTSLILHASPARCQVSYFTLVRELEPPANPRRMRRATGAPETQRVHPAPARSSDAPLFLPPCCPSVPCSRRSGCDSYRLPGDCRQQRGRVWGRRRSQRPALLQHCPAQVRRRRAEHACSPTGLGLPGLPFPSPILCPLPCLPQGHVAASPSASNCCGPVGARRLPPVHPVCLPSPGAPQGCGCCSCSCRQPMKRALATASR